LKRSNRLILLIGVFLAALAFVFVIILLGGGQTGGAAVASAPPTEVETVVAARDIPLGVTVTAAMVTTQVLPVTVQEAGVYGDVTQTIGKVARQTITKGQQVTRFQFSDTGANAQIECRAGFTCIAVQVDQVSGVGTLIKTGDFVDLVVSVSPTFPLNSFLEGATSAATILQLYDPTSVKVLIQGVQVVATLLPPPPAPADPAVATPAPEAGVTSLTGQQEIVIIAVTPQQAELVKFAQLDGTITLMLRSPKDFVDETGNPIVPVTVTTSGIVLKTLIEEWGVLPPLPIVVPEPTPIP
jgi:Flp pilus assembly protein CpaB